MRALSSNAPGAPCRVYVSGQMNSQIGFKIQDRVESSDCYWVKLKYYCSNYLNSAAKIGFSESKWSLKPCSLKKKKKKKILT